MGENSPHVLGAQSIRHILEPIFGWEGVVSDRQIDVAPEDNPTNEPEPDVYVLRSAGFRGKPAPRDLALLVEIDDVTLQFDTTTKAALYAHAGIAEYWVLDLNGRRLIVHRDASGSVYRSVIA